MNDPMDLPNRKVAIPRESTIEVLPPRNSPLSERHMDTLVDAGAKGLVVIASGLFDLAKIKSQKEADVALIEARSDALCAQIRAEVDRVGAERQVLAKRGEIAVDIIHAVLSKLNTADPSTHRTMVEILPGLVERTINLKVSPGTE